MFAGAAFTDSADIKVDTEVVDTLVSLGVVNGYDDGSFKPNGTVTRAEMAKMIYVLRTGNSDASAYNDDKTSFTDINGHWARGYIKYCQSLGIIAGKSNTIFAPNANVTAQEAAKMLLVTLGYDPQKAGLVGSSWASKTNALADEAGLLEDVNTSFTAACPRQYAAQLIYNTIFAKTVVLRDGEYTKYGYDNTPNPTVGEKYMGLIEYTGTYEGNSDVITTLKDGEIKVGTQTATFDMDNDLIGEEVTVLFKDHKNGTANELDTKDTVFGVYATGETKVYRLTKDDMQTPSNSDLGNGKIKFNDKTYEVVDGAYVAASGGTPASADTILNVNYGASTVQATASQATKAGLASYFTNTLKKQSGDAIKFVCNSDNKIFRAYVTESKLAKVNSVNSDKVSLSGVASIKFEDNNIYSGIKKDDVVVVTTYFNSSATSDDAYSVVEKAETVTGKLEGFKLTSSGAVTKVTVAGTAYNVDKETLASGLTDDAVTTLNNNNINDEVTLYLVNGYVGAIDAPDTASDYAYVEDANSNNGNDGDLSEFKMKVILADGSEKTVTVDKDSKCTERGDTTNKIQKGDLVKYASINSSNVMDLDSVVYKNTAGKDGTGAVVYNKDTKTFDGVMTESDAVLFVKTTNDYYAYNLRSLNNITVDAGTKNYFSVVNSDGKVEAAVVELSSKPSGATSDTVYGIVSKDNGVVKVGDDYQKFYMVSNNEGDYKVYMGASSTKLEKGDIVYFDQASDNVYSDNDVKKLGTDDTTNFLAAYAKELDSDKVLSYYTAVTNETDGTHKGSGTPTNIALENDAKIVYVDKDNNKAGDDIGVNEFDKITGYKNIAVVKNSSGKIDAIIVETSNECDIYHV